MHVLIIEDEAKIAQILVDYFEREGFTCSTLDHGSTAVAHIKATPPDFIVLDLMLPGKDGISICREVRQFSQVPILMLTAKGDEIDRLLGLQLGADDYVCKPFSPREVVTRAKTIMRRVQGATPPDKASHSYKDISVYTDRHVCLVQDTPIDLTPVEFRLLCTLVASPERVFSRNQLMVAAYDDGRIVSDRTIDSHVKNLRKKLALHTREAMLHAIYGVGYKLTQAI